MREWVAKTRNQVGTWSWAKKEGPGLGSAFNHGCFSDSTAQLHSSHTLVK